MFWNRILNRLRGRKREDSVPEMKGRDGIDLKLRRYLPERGFFIEAGGFDGVTSSNTYYLQFAKNWNGLLIEPDPELFKVCCENRIGAHVVQAALVANSKDTPFVDLNILEKDRSMSYIGGASICDKAAVLTNESGSRKVRVEAITVSELLSKMGVNHVDFFSLDVEGFEPQVIHGIDFTTHAVDRFLIECLTPNALTEVTSALKRTHVLECQVSERDFLFCRRR